MKKSRVVFRSDLLCQTSRCKVSISTIVAQALPLPRSKPFVPTKSDRLLTVPEAVELPGEKRRLQRAEFDAAKAERDLKQQVRPAPFGMRRQTGALLRLCYAAY